MEQYGLLMTSVNGGHCGNQTLSGVLVTTGKAMSQAQALALCVAVHSSTLQPIGPLASWHKEGLDVVHQQVQLHKGSRALGGEKRCLRSWMRYRVCEYEMHYFMGQHNLQLVLDALNEARVRHKGRTERRAGYEVNKGFGSDV